MSLTAGTTHRVSEAQVLAVPEPRWTKTWHPVSHGRVIHALNDACEDIGMGITKREYSLSANGGKCFSVWHIDNAEKGISLALGWRNAINKTMALAMAAGTSVFVCDNLAISGEFLSFRKHTSGLDQQVLIGLCENAVTNAIPRMKKFRRWQENLQMPYVSKEHLALLVYEAMIQKVLPPSNFEAYHRALDEELLLTHNFRSLSTVHGAFTRLHRSQSLFSTSHRSGRLQQLVQWYVDHRMEHGPELPKDFITVHEETSALT